MFIFIILIMTDFDYLMYIRSMIIYQQVRLYAHIPIKLKIFQAFLKIKQYKKLYIII